MKQKNIYKGLLFIFLLMINGIFTFADTAVVVSKQELPHGKNNLKARIFVRISGSDNDRANAYFDLYNTNRIMPMQEFSDMIQIGDVIEYISDPSPKKDGRYTVINYTEVVNLNGKNIYKIFVEELEDSIFSAGFRKAREIYEAQRGGR